MKCMANKQACRVTYISEWRTGAPIEFGAPVVLIVGDIPNNAAVLNCVDYCGKIKKNLYES